MVHLRAAFDLTCEDLPVPGSAPVLVSDGEGNMDGSGELRHGIFQMEHWDTTQVPQCQKARRYSVEALYPSDGSGVCWAASAADGVGAGAGWL
jgi:hypothetical protein